MSNISLLWLGTGSGLNLALGNTSFLLDSSAPRTVLVDCGFTVPGALLDRGRLGDVTDILVTHLHADHIGGLETLAFYHRFVCRNLGDARPRLHLPSENLAHALWEHSLRAGMRHGVDERDEPYEADLETYFQVSIGADPSIDGFPAMRFVPTVHVPEMENYALRLANGVYYSADSVAPPPPDASLIFQDVTFMPRSAVRVHASYEELRDDLPADLKRRLWLVHIGAGWETYNPEADGFAGFVKTGQRFDVPME